MAWGYTQVFTGRAALLHLGAFTATIMSANVFFVIIPNQKIVVADLKAGRTPDPKYGKIAKLRSTHNNYLTLPVLFLMLSNHYPLAFATEYNWLIASLVFLMGVTIRHYFNTMHATGKGNRTGPGRRRRSSSSSSCGCRSSPGSRAEELAELSPMRAAVRRGGRASRRSPTPCSAAARCATPPSRSWPGVHRAPKGVILDNRGRHRRATPARSTCRPGAATRCRRATSPRWSRPSARRSSTGTRPRSPADRRSPR